MADKTDNPFKFWQELKRRKVVRVVITYAAAAFVLLELVDIIAEPLGLPEWTINLVLVLLCIGFVISVILSWIYDITPDGVKKTERPSQASSEVKQTASIGWKISTYTSVLVIIAFVLVYVLGNIKQSSDISKLDKSIAVLPFENWSIEEEDAHLGDAIADQIATQLFKVKDFDVRSYTSSSQYKGSDKPSMPQIGSELNANFIIEGTIERQNDDVSINVKVIQAGNDNQIWADKFDVPWKDIIKLRAQIALGITEELKTRLSPEEIENIEKKPTENSEAYDFYMKGRYYWKLRTKEGVMNSIEYFEQAIELDNEYALAYSGLADAYNVSASWYFMNPYSAFKKARLLAFKSISIDNNIAEPYATLALIAESLEYDNDLAEFCFKKALAINPDYASANQWYALHLTQQGKFDEAFSYMEIALKFDPESAIINYASGMVYFYAEEYDKALSQLNKTLKINPSFSVIDYMLLCYLHKGQYSEVIEVISEYEKNLDRYLIGVNFKKMANEILNDEGINGLIRYIIELELQTTNPFRYLLPILYAFIGDNERALDVLESNVQEKTPDFLFLNVTPAFKNLHSEPRFIELVKKMNFE